jgi:thiol-disulfide isomerase/thioredoxin
VLTLIASVVLALVFLVSAIAKFRDRAGATKAVRDFGVPRPLSGSVGAVLPALELIAAVLLLVGGRAGHVGGITAGALLGTFTVGILANIARGNRVACRCFGELSSKALGWGSVVRNLSLLALASVVIRAGGGQRTTWDELSRHEASALRAAGLIAALAAVLVVQGCVIRELVRRYGGVLLRLEAVEGQLRGEIARVEAPTFTAKDLDGGSHDLGGLLADDRSLLLLFTSPGCGPCVALVPEIVRWAEVDVVKIVVISAGDAAASREKFAASPSMTVLEDEGVSTLFGVDATPAAVLITVDRMIAAGPAYGAEAIAALVAPMIPPAASVHLAEGDTAPALLATDDTGAQVDPAELVGDGVLLFWDTACDFCQQVQPALAEWEREFGGHGRLVLVSRTDVAAVRSSGLTSPVVHDPHAHGETAYGVPGTPSAVAVKDGKIAGAVAVGGPEVLDLLARQGRRHLPWA